MSRYSKWYRTGEARIVPWYFGLMRAEFLWRRDHYDSDGEVASYQLKPRGAGRLPAQYDGPTAFGFWSTLATPDDARYGDRAIWRKLISWFRAPPKVV